MTPLCNTKGQRSLEEKLILGLVQDETRFKHDVGIWGEPVKELILVQVHLTNPTRTTKLGALLSDDALENFKAFLQKNANVFA